MDVFLTISFKLTAEIDITKHMFCVLLNADEDVYRRFEKHNNLCSFIYLLPWNMRLHCFFFTANSLVNAAGDHLAGGIFMEKA